MDRGERADWFAAPWVWYYTIIAASAFFTLIYHEWHTAEPIVQIRLLMIKDFSIPTALLITLIFTGYGMQILNPIFLQDLLHYTAWQAGLLMLPRGLGLTAAMFFLGGIARRGFDTRPLVGFGFCLVGISVWLLGSLNLNMAPSNFVWPTVVQGIGMGLVFPNLSASALSSIPREQMGYATSLFSMTRNVGASIGTSVLTTMLIRKQQVQQSYLVEHVSVFDAWRMTQAPARTPGAPNFDYMAQLVGGQNRGLAMIYGVVQSQAMMISLNNIYRTLAGVMVIGFVSCVLLPRANRRPAPAAH
jgi:DHA2 family multidrug resistance protein